MANNKLLGTLVLDSGKVIDTIDKVNAKLKTLGQGVDLNLTNILNTKVNSQLQELKRQIDEVGKASRNIGGGSAGQVNQLKEVTRLMQEQFDAQIKFEKATSEHGMQYQVDRYNKASNALKAYNEELQIQAYLSPQMQKMQQRLDEAQVASIDRATKKRQDQFDKDYAQLEKEEQARIAAEEKIQQQRERLNKANNEAILRDEFNRRDQWSKDIEAFKKNTDDTIKLIEQKRQAQQKATDAQVQDAAKVYKEQLDIEKKLASGTAGPNETAVLNQQLAEKKAAFEGYSKSIQDAAKADASVVKAQQDVVMAQAQAQDRALREGQKAQEEAARKAEEDAKRLQDYRNKWRDYAVSAVGAISIAVLKEQWTAAINYATQYYDAQNEIRMVTEMSEADATRMGQNMRDLAEEMKVTSTDLSKAAITFYRQGLNDSEVQKRLKWVTEYAKVANVDFNEAAQLMTAAVNTMGSSIEESGVEDAVQRIADVWLYLGDNAATSGKEIGIAMQKASASAKEFGLSFEWLGTYIAVVSEQTRQAPEVIGTAFNSMLARMHQIKLSGFNSEDATKVNDVAKALATLNIELFDGEGKWRDMNLIYEEIAEQWGDMDAKQRALLATTMAGTRQQNVFYALMNDMSKGLEGGSRAWELYEGAMNSAGTASRKYAIYQESIAASQADMKNSLEQLYSNLQPGVIKGFYDIITLIVDGLNNMSIAIPLVIAGITALGVTIKAITASMNPFVAVMAVAASVLGALIGTGGLGALFGGLKGKSFSDLTEEIAESTDKIASLQSAQSGIEEMLAKVQSGATLTTGEIKKYTSALNTIATVSPSAEKAVKDLTGGFGDQAAILETQAAKTQEAIDKQLLLRKFSAEQALGNYANSGAYNEAAGYTEDYYNAPGLGLDFQKGPLKDYIDLFNLNPLASDYWEEVDTAIDNFFKYNESRVTNAIREESKSVTNNVIDALGADVNNVQREYLSEIILDMLTGDDGTLDYADLAESRIKAMWVDLRAGAEQGLADGEQYRSWLFDKLSDYIGVPVSDLSEMLIMETSQGDIVDVATEMMEDMLKLASAGADVNVMMTALSESTSWDDFSNKLKGIKETVQEAVDAVTGEDEGPLKPADRIKQIKEAYTEIDKIQDVVDSLNDKEPVKLKNILEIAESHPEIMAFANDVDLLKEKLRELKEAQTDAIKLNLKEMLLDSEEAFASSGYGQQGKYYGVNTFRGLIEAYGDMSERFGESTTATWIEQVDAQINKMVEDLVNLGTETSNTSDSFQTFLTNIDNLNKAKEALEVITKPLDNDPTKVASAWKTLLEIFTELNPETSGVDDVKAAVDGLDESTRNAAQGFGELGQAILDSMNKTEDAIKEAAEAIRTSFEDSKAATEGYQAQVDQLSEALSSGGVGNALTTWEGFSKAIREGIQEQFPNLITALADAKKASEEYGDGTEEAEKALTGLEHELRNVTKNNAVRYFNNTVKAIDGLNKGTMKASDAYVDFNKEAKKAITAQSEFNTANLNFAKGVEVSASDVKNLASYLGDLDPEWVLDNWEQVGPMLSAALAEGQEAFDRLNEAAFINITGTSSADFSAIMDGLIMVEDEANAAVQALMATGQWKIEERDLEQNAPVWIPGRFGGGRWDTVSATGKYKILVPTGTSPFAKKGGGSSATSGKTSGGGGGGGGGKKNAGPSEVEIMLDRMEQIQGLQNHSRSLYQAQAGYYSQTGELQGVIKYYQKEIEAIKEQNVTLEENVAELDTWIQKKKAEVDSLDKGSDEYSTAADELKDLQERHQEYTLQLMENTTEVDKLTKAIKEQNKAIRDMEIDLRNTILQAIQDREELNDRMTQGEVDTQNTILELIKKRYEAERDLILENADKQIDSLQKERDLLDEQLQLRKQQAEEEDKAIKLAELEAKYAQISTDPTRQKEALSIQKEIKNLRDEIAWDMAEKEVKAQQDRLDQQVTSLEDYKTYVEEYYEDLFEHPKKLIAEMKEIIKGTDEEIIAWLVANDMVYAEATDAVKEQTMKSWEEMLRNMRGGILTYWDEVEEVIAGGDDNIIAFLKENSADYREAGKLQAEAYVEEWLDKLEKLRLAYKQVSGEIAPYDYSYVEPGTGSGSGGGGGGGGSGGSSQSKKAEGTAHGYTFTFDGKVYRNTGYASSNAAANAAQAAFSTLTSQASQHLYQTQGAANAKKMIDAWASSIKAYKLGGMAYDTGLAWIDGTPGRPERILSGYQTELFESLVRSMEAIGRISVSSMPYLNDDLTSGGNTVSVGDIIVNVDRMETDADYESMADRVLNAIVEKLNRGSVVGGIRFSR